MDKTFIASVDHSTEMGNFIEALKRPSSSIIGKQVQDFEYDINVETYRAIFAKAKETRASSPSGIHYGHYMAACQDDSLPEVNALFMRVPFQYGFALDRWSASLHCMLQKKRARYIDKLRIIQLFEADFNSALKYILGRKLLYHGEDQCINSNQTHGSRPGRSTHDALTITTLSADLARLERLTMIIIFNDTAGCYDRMLHNFMTVTARRMGCPKHCATLKFSIK